MTMKALVRVKTVRFKSSDKFIGYRLEAAVPNLEGLVMRPIGEGDFYATKIPCPSYRKPFFIAESSDHSRITMMQIDRFLDQLRWAGYGHFEFCGKYEGEPLINLTLA